MLREVQGTWLESQEGRVHESAVEQLGRGVAKSVRTSADYVRKGIADPQPEGISRGDFYELHYTVDPWFKGTGVRGQGWSGKKLGLKEYGLVGRLWHGSPPPLKARVGGSEASVGGAVYAAEDEETGR